MTKVTAGITTSVDGFVCGPDDGRGRGLGTGGERLHYWVFGGPWTYDAEPEGQATGEDKEWLDRAMSELGAVVAGRWTYEAADHWGDANPWGLPFFVVTHRPEEQPEGSAFTFVGGLEEALARARDAAGTRNVHVMGGADIIRQALAGGHVDELTIGGPRPPRRWEAAVRGVRPEPGARAPRRAAVAVRHLHRLSGGTGLTGWRSGHEVVR
jgi:dihydrofolate reductase